MPSAIHNAEPAAPIRARSLTLSAVFAALMAASAAVSIPIPGGAAPITLQVFICLLSGAVGGAGTGALAMVVYLLMGSAGLPVFSMLRGGPSVVLGPSGGYLAAFPLAAALVGIAAGPSTKAGFARLLASMIAAVALIHAIGTLRLAWITGKGLGAAAGAASLPFIPVDVAKAFVAAALAPRLRAAFPRPVSHSAP